VSRLLDIAQRVGVSVSTVSRVLNDRPDARVSDALRSDILTTAAELGYRPNHFARALRRGRGSHVTVCVWSYPGHFSPRRTSAIPAAAAAVRKPVVTIDAAHLQPIPEGVLELLLSQLPEVAVFVGGSWQTPDMVKVVNELHARDVHCVLADLDEEMDPELPCDTVRADRAQGSALAVTHLADQGHRHIGLVSSVRTLGRHKGYMHALTESGLTQRYIASLDPWPADQLARIDRAREATRVLLETHPQVTALFCATDVIALAAMQAARSVGRRVPEDLAVAGFDNDLWTHCLPTPLTTVEHPLDGMTLAVQDILSARLAGDEAAWRRLVLDYRLITRASTGATSVPGGEGEA